MQGGSPVHSSTALLRTPVTVCGNQVVPIGLPAEAAFAVTTHPPELQSCARALAGIRLAAAWSERCTLIRTR